jgi:large subunit ribosomal protein L22
MEAKANVRYVRLAPRKARAVVDLIRRKNIDEALSILRYTPRRAAGVVAKVVKSAAANAEHNMDMKRSLLYIDQAYVDEGPTMKRIQPRARGRRFLILKRSSHITVVVKERKEV